MWWDTNPTIPTSRLVFLSLDLSLTFLTYIEWVQIPHLTPLPISSTFTWYFSTFANLPSTYDSHKKHPRNFQCFLLLVNQLFSWRNPFFAIKMKPNGESMCTEPTEAIKVPTNWPSSYGRLLEGIILCSRLNCLHAIKIFSENEGIHQSTKILFRIKQRLWISGFN